MNKIIEKEEYCELIVLYKGEEFKVKISKEDVDKVKKNNWNIWIKKRIKKNKEEVMYYYVARNIYRNRKYNTLYLHHVIIGKPQNGFVVDHINRYQLDNRRENLRIATRSENVYNSDRFD